MKIIILAGGGGTRLFPISRTGYPKQFMAIESEMSLLAEAVKRYLGYVKPEDIVVVTNEKLYFHIQDELAKINALGTHIVTEPCARNTAPAIALAQKYLIDELKCGRDEVVFVGTADHIIRPKDEFIEMVKKCTVAAQKNKIITLGIKPDKPETGYGYIKSGLPWEVGYVVDSFVEKPDIETAKAYLVEGNYYWNSGMFCFTIETFMEELEAYEPDMYRNIFLNDYNGVMNAFSTVKSISIDYAIAERSTRVVIIPLDVYWNDVGSWDSIYGYMQKDNDENVISGDSISIDCRGSMLMSNERLVAGIGLKDIIVVETDDVIMVVNRDETQKVKQLIEKLKDRNTISEHNVVKRPWGRYKVLTEAQGYKVKKITVLPGKKLSLQLHNQRCEHWIVINGVASVVIGGDDERRIRKNESIYIPKDTKHRLMNLESELLEIIEVQNGEYLGEDDIVRFDDAYGRC